MIAGLVLEDKTDKESFAAFLDDDLECFSFMDNGEILDLMEEREPELIVANVGLEQSGEELTKDEKQLKENGFVFTPNSHREKVVKRLDALKNQLMHQRGLKPEFIRFDPQISASELAIDGDRALEGYGINPSDIDSAGEFDAVIGCITGRFYQENQFQDLGVIVPKSIGDEDEEDPRKDLDPRA